jgi:tetratricopeptide (TPR) repeat protein
MRGDPESQLGSKVAEIERELGSDNPRFADSLMELAGMYASSGKTMYAEPLFWRALAIRRKLLGETHAKVAETLISLGALYETYEQFPEAERFYQWVLRIREEMFGRNHMDVAIALESMARVLKEQHRDDEASKLEAEAEEIWANCATS